MSMHHLLRLHLPLLSSLPRYREYVKAQPLDSSGRHTPALADTHQHVPSCLATNPTTLQQFQAIL